MKIAVIIISILIVIGLVVIFIPKKDETKPVTTIKPSNKPKPSVITNNTHPNVANDLGTNTNQMSTNQIKVSELLSVYGSDWFDRIDMYKALQLFYNEFKNKAKRTVNTIGIETYGFNTMTPEQQLIKMKESHSFAQKILDFWKENKI